MLSEESHISHRVLLAAVDGELSPRKSGRIESHLAACWACRVRKQEIETAIREFIHLRETSFDLQIQPADGPRALLGTQLAQRVTVIATNWIEAYKKYFHTDRPLRRFR